MRACLLALMAIALFGMSAMSQPPSPDAAKIARLITALESGRFVERERATRDLIVLEAVAIEPLRQALGSSRSLEFRRRAEAILETLAIYEAGGEIVNGLKVRLSADRAKAGDSLKLTTTFCNMTDKPLNVMVGYTTCGNYFECGAALRRVDLASGKPVEVEAKCQVGFCGTGAGPMYVTIAAKSVVRFETLVMAAQNQDGKKIYTLGSEKYFNFEPLPGEHNVRMTLSVGATENTARSTGKGAGIRPADENAPFWSGTIRSNDVAVRFHK